MIAYNTKQTNQEKALRKIGYGKTMSLFSLMVAICGQMIGFYAMFQGIEEATKTGETIKSHLVFAGIKETMICLIYGILIYLFSLLLWVTASAFIKKLFKIYPSALLCVFFTIPALFFLNVAMAMLRKNALN